MATVLVVDDEPDIRELVRINLELDGHAVITAADGREGLDRLRKDNPDIVLLDVMMPGIDGWEVLGSIKADTEAALAQTPVLMLTARADDLDRVRGGIEGAIRYITKPFAVADLRQAVRDALAGDPEPLQRRRAQQDALERLARIEKGDAGAPTLGAPMARPHLTKLERAPAPPRAAAPSVDADAVASLSDKQKDLLRVVGATPTVRAAAEDLGVSRSNVYASLRRIARKLAVRSVPELVDLARQGDLAFDDRAP